jgi:hypothetical protein
MEKRSLGMETKGKKSRAVKSPQKNSGEVTEAGEKNEKAATKKHEKAEKNATKKAAKKKRKGAKKALRHAVQREVKEKCDSIAEKLVNQTREGNMSSAEMVMDLMEKKKKKDGEGGTEPDGPSLAEQLAGPSWADLQEARRIVSEAKEMTKSA